ncbi:oxidoreductase [Amycolatopsis cihanbeyliensis]|uniref:oxidoreductase n=1 Tax=Amycolatopsis cihanbeyliensis TaxID=1128664 RepID=UPI001152C237|nr:oxidoreductase [Amycolatopsis cihanbeyliensis]
MVDVGLFDALRRRRKGGQKAGTLRKASSTDTQHLDEWTASRRGVEAYVEPRTNVTETTVVLIAHDGEWTRRRIDSLEAAQQFGKKRSMPVYEVAKVGYPQRMRDYTERQRILKRRRRQAEDTP